MEFALSSCGKPPPASYDNPVAFGERGVIIYVYLLWVGLGGAIGTIMRFWILGVVAQNSGETFTGRWW